MTSVTGGARLIDTKFVLDWLPISDQVVKCVNALNYPGNRENPIPLDRDERRFFVHNVTRDPTFFSGAPAYSQADPISNVEDESRAGRFTRWRDAFTKSYTATTFPLLNPVSIHRNHWKAETSLTSCLLRRLHDGGFSPLTKRARSLARTNRRKRHGQYLANNI
ncbi:hypothetical protein [Pseudomonas sp. LB3P38]|uniref:hypothetical protein n=1 Tax=Pseudomonas lyxosi TaxID=3398358 RepID=UPI0039F07965